MIEQEKKLNTQFGTAMVDMILRHLDRYDAETLDDLLVVMKEFCQAVKWNQSDIREECAQTIKELLFPEIVGPLVTVKAASDSQLDEFKVRIGKTLRLARQESGMTQEELARKSGLPQSHISRIERGEHSPSYKTVKAIADALSTTPESIYDDIYGLGLTEILSGKPSEKSV